jgi:pimeloyl-ACP methyl ester carboxylesterase
MKRFAALFVALLVLSTAVARAQPAPPLGLGREFSSQFLKVDGVMTHYVRGGSGPAIVLLHGFPQDWFEWQKIMPRLARRFTVVALDLPGIGGSSGVSGRYDAAAMARIVDDVMVALELRHVYLVGHDLGGMVAYALARQDPDRLRGVMVLDVPLPGIAGWSDVQLEPEFWHVRFMQAPGRPEEQIVKRQADFFDRFFAPSRFSSAEKAHYVQAYSSLAQLHAAVEIYRAFPVDETFNAAQRDRNDLPVFLGFGAKSSFVRLLPKIADGLRSNGMTNVQTGTVPDAGHYLLQDNPQAVAELIERQATLP